MARDMEDEDASLETYERPDEMGGMSEAAAVSRSIEALAGVSSELLDIKGAIEEGLAQAATQATGPSAFEVLGDAANIQGVGIGLGLSSDSKGVEGVSAATDPGVPGITLFVAEPTSAEQARAAIVESMGVRAAGSPDVPVEVVVTGIIDAQPHRFRLRPAPGGISVGHVRITAGTIGCLARGRTAPRNSRLLVLSNNHVLANSNAGRYGDCIVQPGPADGGRCPADQIAILERFVPINFSGGVNYVDCATAWAWPDRVRRELIYISGGVRRFFRIGSSPTAPVVGMLVGKSGRTTQLTTGRITAVGVSVNVNYNGRVAHFRDQISIQGLSGLFSAGGDSGSSIWTWTPERRPVALLFAGGGSVTFANRMDRVISAVDVVLVT
jgi:hypothetical protein